MYVSEDFAHQVLLANYGNTCQKISTMYCGFEFELLNINEIVGFG